MAVDPLGYRPMPHNHIADKGHAAISKQRSESNSGGTSGERFSIRLMKRQKLKDSPISAALCFQGDPGE